MRNQVDVPHHKKVSTQAIALFPHNVSYLLEQCKMSQTQLADKLGITHQTFSKYMNGQSNPPLVKMIEIAEVLGVTPDALLYHDLRKKSHSITYHDDIAPSIVRPLQIPECALRRYRQKKWFMYYYSLRDNKPVLCEAVIQSGKDVNMHYIDATLTTEYQTHRIKLVVDYPRYIYLYGINKQNPTRFFIMFPDLLYTRTQNDFLGSLALCTSVIPETNEGLPGMQLIAFSAYKIDLQKFEEQLRTLLTIPDRRRLLRLHPEQNEQYISWLRSMFCP